MMAARMQIFSNSNLTSYMATITLSVLLIVAAGISTATLKATLIDTVVAVTIKIMMLLTYILHVESSNLSYQ